MKLLDRAGRSGKVPVPGDVGRTRPWHERALLGAGGGSVDDDEEEENRGRQRLATHGDEAAATAQATRGGLAPTPGDTGSRSPQHKKGRGRDDRLRQHMALARADAHMRPDDPPRANASRKQTAAGLVEPTAPARRAVLACSVCARRRNDLVPWQHADSGGDFLSKGADDFGPCGVGARSGTRAGSRRVAATGSGTGGHKSGQCRAKGRSSSSTSSSLPATPAISSLSFSRSFTFSVFAVSSEEKQKQQQRQGRAGISGSR
ncbi:uncharacterized protein LOC133356770 [Lethenteron reissneri]|uniref:uncharacterized protein LOC133356770 n=1 Tax=Lethenteron reissneri TaxID=7753 RepID=UPI002AB7911E|nr:uncharacterized protein LOC133356770 [Lethenteron reissneri]